MDANLLNAYRWHRFHAVGNRYPRAPGSNPATEALQAARVDVSNGTDLWPDDNIYPAVSWDSEKSGIAYVQNANCSGLRHVGDVVPESYGGSDCWSKGEPLGWYTDPHGDVFKDGSGLCYGVVYQLPGRRGVARFVAGYIFGGMDGGPTLDLGTIYESEEVEPGYWRSEDPKEDSAARKAAYQADALAKAAADDEREYQTAWQAGSRWRDILDEEKEARKEVRNLLAERRAVRQRSADYPAICATIRSAVRKHIEGIWEKRAERRELARGDYGSLIFYPADRLKDAFCEGAGLSDFPS